MSFFKLEPEVVTVLKCPDCKKQTLETRSTELFYMCTNCGFIVNKLR